MKNDEFVKIVIHIMRSVIKSSPLWLITFTVIGDRIGGDYMMDTLLMYRSTVFLAIANTFYSKQPKLLAM